MIHFVLLISRQGKVRLTKWYSPYSQKERSKDSMVEMAKEEATSISNMIAQVTK
ncbi:AP-1 complex subunit sigma-2 [Linum grandiflorum]